MTPLAFVRPRNLMTYVSVACGLLATTFAGGEHARARVGALLAAAAFADLVDGRFARLFGGDEMQKKFGVQIDSLADAVTFGLAPVVCLERLVPAEGAMHVVMIAAGLAFVLAALTRLGFYNIEGDSAGFVGMPTTIAGIAWAALLFATPGAWVAGALVVLAALMVAPIAVARPGAKVMITLLVGCVGIAVGHLLVG